MTPGSAAPAVYVVDDDEAVRDSTRMVLQSYGMNVRTFSSGTAFLSEVADIPFGCVLLDQHMPEMNGIELLETMRARGMTMPVIMITAKSGGSLKERALRAGASALLDKPVADDDLVRAIGAALPS
jgi:two-component system response regulator FixJ